MLRLLALLGLLLGLGVVGYDALFDGPALERAAATAPAAGGDDGQVRAMEGGVPIPPPPPKP